MGIGSVTIFHLSKLWKAKFFILCDVTSLVRAAGEIWYWSLLGVKGFIMRKFAISLALRGQRACHPCVSALIDNGCWSAALIMIDRYCKHLYEYVYAALNWPVVVFFRYLFIFFRRRVTQTRTAPWLARCWAASWVSGVSHRRGWEGCATRTGWMAT